MDEPRVIHLSAEHAASIGRGLRKVFVAAGPPLLARALTPGEADRLNDALAALQEQLEARSEELSIDVLEGYRVALTGRQFVELVEAFALLRDYIGPGYRDALGPHRALRLADVVGAANAQLRATSDRRLAELETALRGPA